MSIHPAIRHEPAPDHPGWWTWEVTEGDRFNATIGRLLVRTDAPGRATVRMFPEAQHMNLQGMLHGGALMTLLDVAFFAGGRLAGADVLGAVTLDINVQFVGPGRAGLPLDAQVELVRETKRIAVLRGIAVQGEEVVASFSGALRKASPKS